MSGGESEAGSAYQDENDTSDGPTSQDQSDDGVSSSESDINSARRDISLEKSPRKRFRSYKRSILARKSQYSEAYRTLYNDTVEDISVLNSTRDSVPASQVGLTVWSSTEKEILFQRVASLGRDDIKDLASAIGSKSEMEVRQFLLLLDQGVVEGNVTHGVPVISAVDVPAALEVSKQSEDALEEFADGLSHYQENADQKREKKRHSGYWLLTEEIATELEARIDARIAEPGNSEQRSLEKPEDDKFDGQDDNIYSKDDPQDEMEVPAAELLNLPSWLRLSQLFMYSAPESEQNWTDFITKPDETPSMYHTAFQDFHNLTVSVTRRLVQASIFQALTRLRARDKDNPAALINAADVRTVVDMMGMRRDRRQFWGSVPRRHGLMVLKRDGSHSDGGRSRSGVKLSLEDAEAILGVGISTESGESVDSGNVIDTVEDEAENEVENGKEDDDGLLDPEHFYEDPELWSEISDSGDGEIAPQHYTISDDHDSNMSTDEEDPSYRPDNNDEAKDDRVTKRRKRGAAAARALQEAQDTYLEAFDREMSRIEEVRMWDALKVPPPGGIKYEEIEIPRPPATKRTAGLTDWREDIEFEAEWERQPEPIREQDFVDMQKRGDGGRKRRRLAYAYLEEQGLVELNRPGTGSIGTTTRQEREAQEAGVAANGTAVAAKTRGIADLTRSQSPKTLQSAWGQKPGDRRSASRDSVTSQMLAQDSNPLAKQMAKRLAMQEKGREKEEREATKRKEREEREATLKREREERDAAKRRERAEEEEGEGRRSPETKGGTEEEQVKMTERARRRSKGKRKSGF